MGRSSMLYMKRKKTVLDRLRPAPSFATNTLVSHRRPHTVLPVLRNKEQTFNRLEQVPIKEVPANVRNEDSC